ncbi:acetamidase/formamidase family protein [Niveispirillum sp. KHB5.9]|uniref:acetamidase/formamidase family protein n=1 Tax=Niveispirillum sp. KHB5.9 TaxID=3400269 RepID=UPI003A8453FF
MATHCLRVDHARSICGDPRCSHNRWHPDIAPALRIASGDSVEIQARDCADGQIRPGMVNGDLADLSMDRCHTLTGPIHVEGAVPGDLLAIHVEKVVPASYGFSAILPGLGLLPEDVTGPFLVHWQCEDGYATSPQLPGIRIKGAPFMGVMGLAPSLERLRRVNQAEARAARNGAMVFSPLANEAVPSLAAVAAEGWRTIAPQDTGGNIDIRQLSAGSTLYLPVDVPGALFSTGDGHYAQGDGESCGTAIEIAATLTARFELLKGAARDRGQTAPSYLAPHLHAQDEIQGYFATTGRSVAGDGAVHVNDATLAARNATREMIRILAKDYDLTPEQAYCAISVAGDLRLSVMVNPPYALASLAIPRSIFARG